MAAFSDEISGFVLFCFVFAILEFIYLTSGAVTLYKRTFASVQRVPVADVRLRMWPFGVLAYLVLFLGVWVFVARDAVIACNAVDGFSLASRASLMGLLVYGVHNLTSAATLEGFGWDVVLLDTVWGIFVLNAVCLGTWAACRATTRIATKMTNRA